MAAPKTPAATELATAAPVEMVEVTLGVVLFGVVVFGVVVFGVVVFGLIVELAACACIAVTVARTATMFLTCIVLTGV